MLEKKSSNSLKINFLEQQKVNKKVVKNLTFKKITLPKVVYFLLTSNPNSLYTINDIHSFAQNYLNTKINKDSIISTVCRLRGQTAKNNKNDEYIILKSKACNNLFRQYFAQKKINNNIVNNDERHKQNNIIHNPDLSKNILDENSEEAFIDEYFNF